MRDPAHLLAALACLATLGLPVDRAGAQRSAASPARQDAASGDTLQINGAALHYEVRGSGPPLVLLHGFFGCGAL
ncbi:MAG TPA: hypothetical protein VHQ45_16655 [Gemmatimonadaceae bacterium]|nr:hypothetical protein [Gemmatimonadaceae bacterium]